MTGSVPGFRPEYRFPDAASNNVVLKGDVRGGYYAPDASIRFTSGAEAYGAFVGDRVVMASGTRFHYDEALADHFAQSNTYAGDEVDLLAWYETAVQPDFLVRDRRDPFFLLNLDPATLPRPADAWIP